MNSSNAVLQAPGGAQSQWNLHPLVTHNCGQILQHCDQALLLHKGQLEFLGQPKSITTIYQRLINTCDEDWRSQAQKLFVQLEADSDQPDPERELKAENSILGESSGYDPNLKPDGPSQPRPKDRNRGTLMNLANAATSYTRVKPACSQLPR